jgi:hypothetical protein
VISQRPRTLQALLDFREILLERAIDPEIVPKLALKESGVREVWDYCMSDQPMPKVGDEITLNGFPAVVVKG